MNIIIPLCGKGERFVKQGYETPKPFIQVLGKEIIRYVLNSLKLSNEDRVWIVCTKWLDTTLFKDYNVITLEDYTRGAAETVLEAINRAGIRGKCVIMDGDTGYYCDILQKVRELWGNSLLCFRSTEALFSYSLFDEKGVLTNIKEKQVISGWANSGVYVFEDALELACYCQNIIDNKITYNNEFYISCVIADMIENGHVFTGSIIDTTDIVFLGTPEQVRSYETSKWAFLFDLDGTLVNTDLHYCNIWNKLLKPYHLDVTPELFDKYIKGTNDHTALTNLGLNINISATKDSLFDARKTIIIEGAKEFMAACHKAGHLIAIVTNNNRTAAEQIIAHWQLKHDLLIVGNECNAAKPSGEPYLRALETFHIPKERAIIFEDSNIGMQAAYDTQPYLIVGINNSKGDIKITDYRNLYYQDLITNPAISRKLRKLFNVDNIKIKEKLAGGYIASVIEVDIDDKSYVLKLEQGYNPVANSLRLYEHEYFFYDRMAHRVPVRTPKCLGLIEGGVVLENLWTQGLKIYKELNDEQIRRVIREIAKLHSHWQNMHPFPGLEDFDMPYVNIVINRFSEFERRWEHVLSKGDMALARKIATHFSHIDHQIKMPPYCIIHGDVKAANIFWDKDNIPVFIDWQYVGYGKRAQDLVFFLIESCPPQDFKMYVEYYYHIQNIKEYKEEIKLAASYFPFVVAVWFGSLPEDELVDKNFPFLFIQKLFKVLGEIYL